MALPFRRSLGGRAVLVGLLVLALVLGITALRPTGFPPGPAPVPAAPGTGTEEPGGNQGGGSAGGPAGPGTATVEPVWHGLAISFGYEERTYLVIDTEEAWRALWARAGVENPPPVDFATRTVLVALHGLAPTAGNDIRITGVEPAASGGYVVEVKATHPSLGCPVAQVLTYPTDMVSIPKLPGPFDFQAAEVLLNCP